MNKNNPTVDVVLDTVIDLAADLFYYDRKEDEDLPLGVIQKMVDAGEITVDEIVAAFAEAVKEHVGSGQVGEEDKEDGDGNAA